MTVVNLETRSKPTLPVDEKTITCLEELLQKAKEGEIQGIAYVTIKSLGIGNYISCGHGWYGEGTANNFHTILGALHYLTSCLANSKNTYEGTN